jgi:hypothetical protein
MRRLLRCRALLRCRSGFLYIYIYKTTASLWRTPFQSAAGVLLQVVIFLRFRKVLLPKEELRSYSKAAAAANIKKGFLRSISLHKLCSRKPFLDIRCTALREFFFLLYRLAVGAQQAIISLYSVELIIDKI